MLDLENGITVLSLFDGMSCGMIALQRAGIKVKAYYASEIDKPAMKVAKHNWPEIIHIGDVTKVFYAEGWLFTENGEFYVGKIDLLIGGSPCQGFSFAGKQLNFEDPRSKLFFEYVRLREETQCEYFFLENVVMKQEFQDVISNLLTCKPIFINSALVSAQNRKRLYWTNIAFYGNPKDREIYLKDIVLSDAIPVTYTERRTEEAKKIRREYQKLHGRDFSPRRAKELVARQDEKSNCLTATFSNKEHLVLTKKALEYMDRIVSGGRNHWDFKHHSDVNNPKSAAIVANFYKGIPYNVLKDFDCIRAFDPIECERLQTVPDNYTEIAAPGQRFRMLGNGWTVDVIAHLFEPLLYVI